METFLFLLVLGYASAHLWPQGIVHFAINKKDYDLHSQDMILDTISKLQTEVCLKFFNSPSNYTASQDTKILYIHNPDKLKDCPPQHYNYHANIVDMPIGYRCLDPKNISRIVMDMLKASIQQQVSPINSIDLTNRFRNLIDSEPRDTFFTPEDRNYINGHYYRECGQLTGSLTRRSGDDEVHESGMLSGENQAYYKKLLWPLGVVMYAVHPDVAPNDPSLVKLLHAMSTIELHSCVVFQPLPPEEHLQTNNFLWLAPEGDEMPALGFKPGNQSLKISSLASGAPGHIAHALHALLRAVGLPMMSNRFDRDNYVKVEWKNVKSGKEHFLERTPPDAWLHQIPYDMLSATHAPANYMCRNCAHPLNALTLLPLQDHLWQRTLSMGHRIDLSESDKRSLSMIYSQECNKRYLKEKK